MCDWVVAVMAAIALGLSIWAIIEAKRSYQADAFVYVSEKMKEHRELRAEFMSPRGRVDQTRFEQYASDMNTVAYMVKRRLVPKDWVLEMWPGLVATWDSKGFQVELGQNRRKHGANRYHQFEWLIDEFRRAGVEGPDDGDGERAGRSATELADESDEE